MKLLRGVLIWAIVIIVIAYGGVVGAMYVLQRPLQYESQGSITPLADTGIASAEDVAIPSDGSIINGWYAPPQAGKPVILYYKGNSGSFSAEYERFAQWVSEGYGFLAFDYRGFPASPGEITQQHILDDAVAAFDWLAEKQQPIVIWGRSLGSGPSTYVASVRDADALLLETPFLSAVTVAGERYPYLPVNWVMLDQFPVNQWIADVTEPVLIAHGTADTVIDVSNGERLYDLVPNKDELWIVPDGTHVSLWDMGIWGHAKPFFARAEAAAGR